MPYRKEKETYRETRLNIMHHNYERRLKMSGKSKILTGFLIYGIAVGLLSSWWWGISDNLFLLNIPGELLGYELYGIAIRLLGDPSSPQAHYSLPWVLRVPQVFVPASTLFWGVIGLVLQTAYVKLIRAAT